MFFCLDPVKHSFCRQEALEVLTQVRIANIDVNVSSSNAALQFWLSSHYHGVCLELIRANPLLWCDVHVSPLALSLDCVASPLSLSLSLSLSLWFYATNWRHSETHPSDKLSDKCVCVFALLSLWGPFECLRYKSQQGWIFKTLQSLKVMEYEKKNLKNTQRIYLLEWKTPSVRVRQGVPQTPVWGGHKMHRHSDLFHALLHSKLSKAKWRRGSLVKPSERCSAETLRFIATDGKTVCKL